LDQQTFELQQGENAMTAHVQQGVYFLRDQKGEQAVFSYRRLKPMNEKGYPSR
jgi:hypothetical protein